MDPIWSIPAPIRSVGELPTWRKSLMRNIICRVRAAVSGSKFCSPNFLVRSGVSLSWGSDIEYVRRIPEFSPFAVPGIFNLR